MSTSASYDEVLSCLTLLLSLLARLALKFFTPLPSLILSRLVPALTTPSLEPSNSPSTTAVTAFLFIAETTPPLGSETDEFSSPTLLGGGGGMEEDHAPCPLVTPFMLEVSTAGRR